MPLTDIQIRAAKAQPGRTIKLSDGEGLQLWLTPSGSKLWNMAYRFGGKQLKLSLGIYPELSLKSARAKRDAAKRPLASGIDPGRQKMPRFAVWVLPRRKCAVRCSARLQVRI